MENHFVKQSDTTKFYTITRFELCYNHKEQCMYKIKNRFKTLFEAKQYAQKYFNDKNCVGIQITIEYGLNTPKAVEKMRCEDEYR